MYGRQPIHRQMQRIAAHPLFIFISQIRPQYGFHGLGIGRGDILRRLPRLHLHLRHIPLTTHRTIDRGGCSLEGTQGCGDWISGWLGHGHGLRVWVEIDVAVLVWVEDGIGGLGSGCFVGGSWAGGCIIMLEYSDIVIELGG